MPSKVDEYWQQLKASTAPKKATKPHLVQKSRVDSRCQPKSDEGGQQAQGAAAQSSGSAKACQHETSIGSALATNGEPVCSDTVFDEDHFRHRLQQLAEAFKSENSAARRQALSEAKVLVLGSSREPPPPEHILTDVAEQFLGKALLRRFDDGSEGCRELAATTFLATLQAAPQAVLALLPYAIPVLEERFCPQQIKERSEEVRLLLAQAVVLLIRLGSKAISAYAAEVVGFVVAMSEDPFHEVAMQACAAVVELNASLGMRLHSVSKQFVAQLLPLTTHKRHIVRIAALQAIRVIMHQNAHEMILEMIAWRDPNMIPIKAFYGDDLKVNFAGKLATDPHPMVRLEFLRTISDWMINLRERVDHEPRLLPYALSALEDACPQVVEEALVLLDKLGEQYESDHAKDLKDTVYYLPHEAHGLGWRSVLQEEAAAARGRAHQPPQLPCSSGSGSGGSGQLASFAFLSSQQAVTRMEGSAGTRQLFVMPGPFVSRPRLGTRILVQGQFSRSMHPLLAELGCWQQEPKHRAALLLRTLLVLGEDALHQYLQHLVPAFCRAIQDPEISPIICDCISIVACYVPPEMVLELLVPRIADGCDDMRSRAAALEVLAHVVRGAGARGAVDGVMEELLDLLTDCDEALLRSEDAAMCGALTQLVAQLVATCGPACAQEQERLLWVLLHLEAAQATQPAALGTLNSIARAAPPASAAPTVTTGMTPCLPAYPGKLCALLADATGHVSVDHMVACLRVKLLERCVPSTCVSMALEARVLARLLLTFGDASQEGSLLTAGREGPSLPQLSSQASCPDYARTGTRDGALASGMDPAACTSPPFWSTHSLDAALERLLTQVPLLAHHTPSAATCLPCLCSLLLHLPHVGISAPVPDAQAPQPDGVQQQCQQKQQQQQDEADPQGVRRRPDAESGRVDGPSACTSTAADDDDEAEQAPGQSGPGAVGALLGPDQGSKLLQLLTTLVEQVADGVPRLWALRCLQQAFDHAATGSSAGSAANAPSSTPLPAAAAAQAPCDTEQAPPPATLPSPLLAGYLVRPWLPRLCHALCACGLNSASPTVRAQGCAAATALLGALGGEGDGAAGGRPAPVSSAVAAPAPLQFPAHSQLEHTDRADGVALQGSSCLPNAGDDGSSNGGSGGGGLERLAARLLDVACGDARPEVACAALDALEALLACAHVVDRPHPPTQPQQMQQAQLMQTQAQAQQTWQQQQRQRRQTQPQGAGGSGAPAIIAHVLAQVMGVMQQCREAALVDCAQRLVSKGLERWPQAAAAAAAAVAAAARGAAAGSEGDQGTARSQG